MAIDKLIDDGDNKYYVYSTGAMVANTWVKMVNENQDDEDTDGSMKTGSTTVTIDGSSHTFVFSKTGGVEGKGKGISGLDDDKFIYKYGLRLKADNDDKYRLIRTHKVDKDGNIYVDAFKEPIIGNSSDDYVEVYKIDSKDLRSSAVYTTDTNGKNGDGEHVKYFGTLKDCIFLVNNSGSLVKNKTAANRINL